MPELLGPPADTPVDSSDRATSYPTTILISVVVVLSVVSMLLTAGGLLPGDVRFYAATGAVVGVLWLMVTRWARPAATSLGGALQAIILLGATLAAVALFSVIWNTFG